MTAIKSFSLQIIVAPKASRNAVIGEYQGGIKIALTAPPTDGKANQALVEFLSEKLGVPKRNISIIRGATNKRKVVSIEGLETNAAKKLLLK